ncbi:MAG: HEPN domain-containing protein [Firmicutes bacterium]|nr:HEPN domain-containing protein [Bacillota bacterium]
MTDSGYIKKELIGLDQIEKLIRRASRDIKVAEANLEIDEEVTYNYAYLAMLRTGRALMFIKGFRPIDGAQHKTVVEFAGAILGQKYSRMIKRFDNMRKKRNMFTYEPDIPVSLTEAKDALRLSREWVTEMCSYLSTINPQINFLNNP